MPRTGTVTSSMRPAMAWWLGLCVLKPSSVNRRDLLDPGYRLMITVAMIGCVCGAWTSSLLAQSPVGQVDAPQKVPSSEKENLAPAPAKVDVKPVARDEEISKRLQSVLEATGWFFDPRVEVKEGVVFLNGRTETDELKKWAGDLARNTQDVVAVANRMEVSEPSVWDFRPAWSGLLVLWRDFIRSLPFFLFGLLILALSAGIGELATRGARAFLHRRVRANLLRNVIARGMGMKERLSLLCVPSLAVLFAVALAFVGIGCLIFFIHHIASSIQAESIIQSAANETIDAIDRLFPAEMGETAGTDLSPVSEPPTGVQFWQSIPARRSGYIQAVDSDGLLGFAAAQNTIVRMERGIGDFVVEGAPLVSVAGSKQPDDEAAAHLDALYSIGRQRTMAQDAAFGIRQIVDVALKALSPGINDTTTAVTCVDYLTAVLARLATRQFESPHRMDEGQLRVIARGSTFPDMLGAAFDQIRQNAAGNVMVLLSLLQALEVIAVRTQDAHRRQALWRQADLIAELANRTIPAPRDRDGIEAALERLAQITKKET